MNGCERLHRIIPALQMHSYPFSTRALPENGIVLMYERGQVWSHGGDEPRIVNVGSHRDGNFASRVSEHFLLNERKMDFTANGVAPKDRSILRKTIGRALLNKAGDPYLERWNIDFTTRIARERYGSSRNVEKEKAIEAAVTDHIRSNFSFRVLPIAGQPNRLGSASLKARIIATLAQCDGCCPSRDWLGTHAPDERIAKYGLWQVQHIGGDPLSEEDFDWLTSQSQ